MNMIMKYYILLYTLILYPCCLHWMKVCNISCTVRWQGTWKLVHGCGESCRPEPKARFTAVVNHVAWSQRRGGDMIRHSREQVSKSLAT